MKSWPITGGGVAWGLSIIEYSSGIRPRDEAPKPLLLSSVCLWHLTQWEPTRSRNGWVHIVHDTLPPTKPPASYHQFGRTCRICSFCTVAWQLPRLLLTRRIARSLGDSWASCNLRPCIILAYIVDLRSSQSRQSFIVKMLAKFTANA